MENKEELKKAIVRSVGEIHPNGKWVWTEYKSGKYDWRKIKRNSTNDKKSETSKTDTSVIGSKRLIDWAKKTSDENLLKVANSTHGKVKMRKIAYDSLKERGFDMSKVDTSGTLDDFNNKKDSSDKDVTNNVSEEADNKPSKEPDTMDEPKPSPKEKEAVTEQKKDEPAKEEETTEKVEEQIDSEIEDKWWNDKNDTRVKKMFDLDTKAGRVKYDRFLYEKKRNEADYKDPIRLIKDLSRGYAYIIKNKNPSFMISAGGEGIGKTYNFKKIAEYFNLVPFDSSEHKEGDGDYDYFMVNSISSAKQLETILKDHNGKLIIFDDVDAILTDKSLSSVVKKAAENSTFKGSILVMTNKSLSNLSKNPDARAIISRAAQKSEINLTVKEKIDFIEKNLNALEFPSVKRLKDEEKDRNERKEILQLIKENEKSIDPENFSIRTFGELLNSKRETENGNEFSNDVALSELIGEHKENWKKEAKETLTKSIVFNDEKRSEEKIEKSKKEDKCANCEGKEFFSELEKAENILFGEYLLKNKTAQQTYTELEKAENIILGF